MKKLKAGFQKIRKALGRNSSAADSTLHDVVDIEIAPMPPAPDNDDGAPDEDRPAPARRWSPREEKSLFFRMLPPELRDRIIKEALGHRTVHIAYGNPPVVPFTSQEPYQKYCLGTRNHAGRLNSSLNHSSQDHCGWYKRQIPGRSNYWVGCVCHRDGSDRPEEFGTHLVSDRCLRGKACCRDYTGKQPHKCWLGVTGWLRSCRQAYFEGMYALYSTSTFHLRPDPGPVPWPATNPCPAFRHIQSLELVVFLGRDGETLAQAHALLQTVPDTFPALRRLYVGFGGYIYDWYPLRPKQTYQDFTTHELPKLDTFARRFLPSGRPGQELMALQLEVGVPTSIFFPHMEKGLVGGTKHWRSPYWKKDHRRGGGFCDRQMVWRSVHEDKGDGTDDDTDDGTWGYWLSETNLDIPDGWSGYWKK